MMGKTHRHGAELAALCIGPEIVSCQVHNQHNKEWIIGMTVIILGSIVGGYAPDIDEPNSKIGRMLFFTLWPIYAFRTLIYLLSLFPGFMKKHLRKLHKILKHRGILHSLLFWILFYILYLLHRNSVGNIQYLVKQDINTAYLLQLCDYLATGFFIGVGTHLLLDMLSDGIMLWFPFSTKRIWLAKIKTNSLCERIIHIIIILMCIDMIYSFLSFKNT